MGNIDIFNQIADMYDNEHRKEIAKIMEEEIRKELVRLDFQGEIMMDYGCGTGLIGIPLHSLFKQSYLVEASENMAKIVEKKAKDLGLTNVQPIFLDLKQDTTLQVKADLVIVAQVLLHVKDTESLLKQLKSYLRPNGILMILDFNKVPGLDDSKIHPGFDQKQLITQLEAIGLTTLNNKTFYHGDNLLMNGPASLFLLAATKE